MQDISATSSGTVTFLFAEVETHAKPLPASGEIVAISAAGGRVYKTLGDTIFAVFPTVAQALNAAYELALGARVRAAVDTGHARKRGGMYLGPAVERATGLLSIAHTGQVLLSRAAAENVRAMLPGEWSLLDLGPHVLRDLLAAERTYQLVAPDLRHEFPALRSLQSHPNNLPMQRTSFVSRDEDLRAAHSALAESRIVTLAGTGGVGKTRLALQLGAIDIESHPDGVWLVELALLTKPDEVARSVASLFGIRETSEQSPIELICAELRARELLLILDNCEHLVDAAAALAEALLRECPGVQLLCTSRQPLRVVGECLHRVGSLAIPEPAGAMTLDEAYDFSAVQLFVDRARAAGADLALDQDAATVVRIVRKLDGIALAIELAASRTGTFSLEQLETMLERRLQLVAAERRGRVERHHTMRALLDWSYDLLGAQERRFFEGVAVFAGGWTLEGVHAVVAEQTSDQWRTADLLAALVDKSLVVAIAQPGGHRYALLESTREYAQEKLRAHADACFQEAHARFYDRFANRATPEMSVLTQDEWRARYRPELENFRVAMDWAIAHDAPMAARFAESLMFFWEQCGLVAEGLARSEAALAALCRAGEETPRASVLIALSRLARSLGLGERAYEAARAALAGARSDDPYLEGKIRAVLGAASQRFGPQEGIPDLARGAELLAAGGDIRWRNFAEVVLVYCYGAVGSIAQARRLAEEITKRAVTLGWPEGGHGAQTNLAEAEFAAGESASAIERARRVASQTHNSEVRVVASANLARYLALTGAFGEAAACAQLALGDAWNQKYLVESANLVEIAGLIAAASGNAQAGVRALGYVDAALGAKGAIRQVHEETVHQRLLEAVRDRLEDEQFQHEYRTGSFMDDRAANAFALEIVVSLASQAERELCAHVLEEYVVSNGRQIALTALEAALLTLLAQAKRALPVDEICDALWPDANPHDARTALNSCIYRLRKKTSQQLVTALGESYRLSEEARVDLWEIESDLNDLRFKKRADKADLDRLAEIAAVLRRRKTARLIRYDWFVNLDARVIALQRYAQERLLSEQVQAGEHRAAARHAMEMLMTDPCDEVAAEYGIRAELALGNPREAKSIYHRHADALKHQLDAAPSARLSELLGAS